MVARTSAEHRRRGSWAGDASAPEGQHPKPVSSRCHSALTRGLRGWGLGARRPDPVDIEGEPVAIVEGADGGGDFDDRVADGFGGEAGAGGGEEFAFGDAGRVAEGQKFHGPAVALAVVAFGDDHSGDADAASGVLGQTGDRAIRVPCGAGEEGEGVVSDGEAEQIHFITEAFEGRGFFEADSGGGGRWQPPAASGEEGFFAHSGQDLPGLPELLRACLPEAIESSRADEGAGFGSRGPHARDEIGDRGKRFSRTPPRKEELRKALDLPQGNPDAGRLSRRPHDGIAVVRCIDIRVEDSPA